MQFGRVLMKPGKPTTLFTVPRTTGDGHMLFFALPGDIAGGRMKKAGGEEK